MKLLKLAVVALVAVFALAQLVQPTRTNPPVDTAASFAAVAKPTPQVAAILDRSCRDCHSSNTVWPWYSHVAPMSWLVARDVNNGRRKLNFSQWNLYGAEMTQIKMGEVCEQVKANKMPLPFYTPLHPEARLTPEDVQTLCATP